MKLDLQTMSLLIGTVIPLLVGIVTKISAPSWVKAVVNAVLSGCAAVGAIWLKDLNVDWNLFLNTFLVTFISSAASYHSLMKPTGAAKVAQNITGEVGIG